MEVINKNNLPVIKISEFIPIQHDLKDLTEKNYNKLKSVLETEGWSIKAALETPAMRPGEKRHKSPAIAGG